MLKSSDATAANGGTATDQTDVVIRKVLHAWADDAADMARVIGRQDPSWRSDTFELAGGHAVLWGSGLYVNRAMAAGVEAPLEDEHVDLLETRSHTARVAPAIEISAATDPRSVELATARSYRADGGAAGVSALRFRFDDRSQSQLDDLRRDQPTGFRFDPADAQVNDWQETSAAGWGHSTVAARRASDAYARAAATIDGTSLFLIREVEDGRAVGCATLSIRGDVATLGGMSTLPGARGRGVQSASINHRLRIAMAAGCTVATTTTVAGGASERNLRRCGFERWFELRTLIGPSRSVQQ